MERKQGQVKVQMSDKTTTVEIPFEIQLSKPLMLCLCLRTVTLKIVWALAIFLIASNTKIRAATLGEL